MAMTMSRLARVNAVLKERLLPPTVDEIKYMNFAVTFLCNSRCGMCDIWEIYRGKSYLLKNELTLAEIQAVFGSPLFRHLRSISLTGGEVFLRRDFDQVVGFFLTKFPEASLTIPTGSINPELNAKTLRAIIRDYKPAKGRMYLSVSLDGIGETHNQQRGINVFDKAMRVIDDALSLDVLGVGVSFTITRENWRDLEQVYDLARGRGIEFSAQFAQNSETYYAKTNLPGGWAREELGAISQVLDRVAADHLKDLPLHRQAADVRSYYVSQMVDYQANPRRIFTCYSGTHSLYLDPYGNVYPCIVLSKKLGNVRERSFEEIWLGAEAQAVRRSIAAEACDCWTPCEALPSLGRSLKPVLFNLSTLQV
jgi:radical SAM protein with 4Fe4S-binding SPASM domain